MNKPTGQMQWQRNEQGDMTLFLRDNDLAPWRIYSAHRRCVRDSADFSPGWLTYNALIREGWELIKSPKDY